MSVEDSFMVVNKKDGKIIYKSIEESIVFLTDVGDMLDIAGVDIDIDMTDIKNIPIIRKALEGDDSIYDMTDEEMLAELIEIDERLAKDCEREIALEDFSKCSHEEFDSLLREVVGDHSINDILGIDNVRALVSEHFNNAILDLCNDWNNWNNDDAFEDALVELLNNEGACTVLENGEVYEILSEHFNNEILDRWIARQDK